MLLQLVVFCLFWAFYLISLELTFAKTNKGLLQDIIFYDNFMSVAFWYYKDKEEKLF